MNTPRILSFREIHDEPVGGKARGLKLLLEMGLNVPDGFVIVYPAKELRDNRDFKIHLKRLGEGPKAIRSSSLSEDGVKASFAGQFETYLNMTGTDGICHAISRCVDNSMSARLQHYTQNRNAGADLTLSVIVQNMVPAVISGVVFSADPVGQRRDKVVINALYGTGESLVSGTKDAYHYEILRSGSNIDRLTHTNGQLLKKELLLELLEGAMLAERRLGFPADMEWAVDESGRLFWLQVRPITTLSDIHYNELDTVKGNNTGIWTLGNIGEMMPGVVTPLTYSTVVDCIDYGMTYLAEKGGAFRFRDRHGYHFIQMFYNRLFINLSHMMDYAKNIWLNKSENIQAALSVQVNPAIRETEKAFLPYRIFNFCKQSVTVIRAGRYLQKLHRLADQFQIDCGIPIHTLYEELGRSKQKIDLGFSYHLITSAQSGTLYSAFMGIITNDKRLPEAGDHHIATILLSDIPDIESADAVKSLEFFSRLIRQDEEFARRFTQCSPAEALRLIRQDSPPGIMQLYREFILRHGHRCVRESELREQPWEENQLHLIHLLQTKVRSGTNVHCSYNSREEIRKALIKFPFHKRIIFKVLLPAARKAVARREISKALVIKMVNELRKGYRALAEKMIYPTPGPSPIASLSLAREASLDDTDQIYFLTHNEIGELIRTGDRSFLQKANRRREQLPETEKLRFPEVCFGIPEPMEECIIPEVREGQIKGTPVSAGSVKAPVRIITSLEDASLLKEGEIMVVSFTDIGWTPYFSIISGLITEIGSPLSHGAVVAREYGIPAVVGAKGAMTFFQNGDIVLLDGNRGIIEKIQQA